MCGCICVYFVLQSMIYMTWCFILWFFHSKVEMWPIISKGGMWVTTTTTTTTKMKFHLPWCQLMVLLWCLRGVTWPSPEGLESCDKSSLLWAWQTVASSVLKWPLLVWQVTKQRFLLFARFCHLRGEPQSWAQICTHCGTCWLLDAASIVCPRISTQYMPVEQAS